MKLSAYRTISAMVFVIAGLFFISRAASADQVGIADSSAGAEKQPQMQEITEALARFKDRDIDGAVKSLEAAVKKNPELPPAYVILAQIYSQANMPQGIIQALEKAAQYTPDDPEAYVLLAQIALRDRRISEAELLLTKANGLLPKLDKNPKRKEALSPAVSSGLAQVYQAREDWATARKHIEQWLKLSPKNTQALQQLASVLFKQKDADGALAKLKEAKASDAKSLTPEAVLALYYQQAGDKDNAKKWMEKALTNAADDLNTQLVAAQLSLENGKLEEAQNRAAAALRIDANSLDAKIIRGLIALFQKDYKAAELYFEAAHLKSPGNFAASNNLALALAEQKDESKRRRALEFATTNVQAYQKTANAVEAASTYGWILYKLDQLDEADKALTAAVSTGQSFSPDTAYYMAVVANAKNRKEEAKTLLKAAAKSTSPFTMRQEATALLEQLDRQ
jgi:tetratricopeptide (TPR) repeat protein